MAKGLVSIDYTNSKVYVHSGLTSGILRYFSTVHIQSCTGVTYDGTNLLTIDVNYSQIYKHSGVTSTITNTYATPTTNPRSLAFDGTNLISSGIYDGKWLYKHNGISESIISSFEVSDAPWGLCWASGNLIRSASSEGKIYKHSGFSPSILASFSAPGGTGTYGLAYDGSNLWSGNQSSDRIYKHSGITSTVLSSFSTPGPYLTGLTCRDYTAVLPTLTTQTVSNINQYTATANGNITNVGEIFCTVRGFQYGLTQTPTWSKSESGSFNTGAYSLDLTGLSGNTTYYVRAFATNSAGTNYGNWISFKTLSISPSVTTNNVTNIVRVNPANVTANGDITNTGGEDVTIRGFKYGLTETDTWDVNEEGTFSAGTYSLTIEGLDPDTTYYIRAYATNIKGTSYGAYVQFKTAVPYWSQKTEIKAEATASDEDIAKVGGKRTLTINNHLIQNMSIAQNIANAYLADYKDQKTKLIITKPCPPPYEIGDTITRGEEGIPYAPAASD